VGSRMSRMEIVSIKVPEGVKTVAIPLDWLQLVYTVQEGQPLAVARRGKPTSPLLCIDCYTPYRFVIENMVVEGGIKLSDYARQCPHPFLGETPRYERRLKYGCVVMGRGCIYTYGHVVLEHDGDTWRPSEGEPEAFIAVYHYKLFSYRVNATLANITTHRGQMPAYKSNFTKDYSTATLILLCPREGCIVEFDELTTNLYTGDPEVVHQTLLAELTPSYRGVEFKPYPLVKQTAII